MPVAARQGLLACAIGALCAEPATAQAPSLVGTWQTTHVAGPDGPAFVGTVPYTPSGNYYAEMAIAPGPHAAGGLVKTPGTYETDGAGGVQVTYGISVMCIATGFFPAPPRTVPEARSSATFTVQYRGSNHAVSKDGTVFLRVR